MMLYNSGCSFTSEHHGIVTDDQMYWYYLALDMGANQIVNDSSSGSSNNLIIQRVYRHLLANLEADTFYIINLTSLNRLDIERFKSDKFQDILTPEAISRIEWESLELIAYSQIVGLISCLNLYKKDYYIINNSIAFQWDVPPPRREFFDFVKDNPRILNLYQYSRYNFHEKYSGIKPWDYDLYGWNGHDGPAGHLAYYHKLKEIIKNRF
jgi:hypothetical protein